MKIIINHISTVDGPTLFPVVVDGNQYNAKLDRFYSASSSSCPFAHTLLLLLEFCRMSCEKEEDYIEGWILRRCLFRHYCSMPFSAGGWLSLQSRDTEHYNMVNAAAAAASALEWRTLKWNTCHQEFLLLNSQASSLLFWPSVPISYQESLWMWIRRCLCNGFLPSTLTPDIHPLYVSCTLSYGIHRDRLSRNNPINQIPITILCRLD